MAGEGMFSSRFRWEIPGFLGIAVLLALYIVASPGFANDWVLDPLTGLVAIVAILAACSQLAHAALDPRASRAWRVVVTLLCLVCITQFFEPLSDRLGSYFGADDCDDFLIIGVAPFILWLSGRFNPSVTRARSVVWIGFAIQLTSTVLDLSVAQHKDGGSAIALWSLLTDLAEFTSLSLFLVAVFLILIDTGRAIGILGEVPELRIPAQYARHGRLVRDHAYPPPFIFGWHLPPANTAAGRIHRLCNRVLWPAGDIVASAHNLWLIASWPFVAVFRAMLEIFEQGEELRALTGKSKPDQLWEQLTLALQYRITPKYYYAYELYHAGQRRQAAHYLSRWETKEIAYRLLYPIATSFWEPAPLRDKAGFARHCEFHNLAHVPILAVFESGRRSDGEIGLPSGSLFIKPVTGKGGGGAERWISSSDGTYVSNQGIEFTASQLFEYVSMLSGWEPYLIQPVCYNHSAIRDLSGSALSTVRVLTARTESGGFEVTNAAFRMSVSSTSAVDNFHAGGIAASVDIRTGRLGPATNLGGDGPAVWHQHHPLTSGVIDGRQLPFWRDATELVVRAHRAFADYALIGWDVALLDDGPALVEGNRGPDVDIIQRTSRGAIGTTRFGDLLAFNLERQLTRSRSEAIVPGTRNSEIH